MCGTRIEIPAPRVRSLCWSGDTLVDWVAGGVRCGLDGSVRDPYVRFSYRFDAAVPSPSGELAVIHERLGTKGLVLRCTPSASWHIVREIDRSFYHADVYDYPVALFTLPDGRDAIAHCPERYDRLDLEVLETGERLTPGEREERADFFYSRLAVDPTHTWLLSAGWIWHSMDTVILRSIPEALADPASLDRASGQPQDATEISSAAFAGAGRLVVSSSFEADFWGDEEAEGLRPGQIAVYDLEASRWLSMAPLEEEAGTLMPVGAEHAVGFYQCPKLIHLPSGRVLHRWPDLDSGRQQSSITRHLDPLPPLALDPAHRRFAVAGAEDVTAITLPADLL